MTTRKTHAGGDKLFVDYAGDTVPAIASRHPIRPPSRPQRWRAAVAELIALHAEYATLYDALSESLQSSPTAEALSAIAPPISISTNWPQSSRLANLDETEPMSARETAHRRGSPISHQSEKLDARSIN